MKIWIGALLFSLLIATRQQSQPSDGRAEEELTDESYKLFISSTPNIPSPSPPYASIPSSIIPDEYPSDPEEVVRSGTIPAVNNILEEVQHASDVESESSKNDKPAPVVKPSPPLIPSEEGPSPPLVQSESIPEVITEIETTTSVPPTSKPIQIEVEPDVSPAETLDKISLIIDQEPTTLGGLSDQESEVPVPETTDGEEKPLPERVATTDDKIPTLVEENKTEQDSIPSFSEWTKLQLAQRKETIINNIKDKTSLQEGKNFASMDCGAKIVASNPEAQNPSGAISSSHDEYMLNRCTVNSWLVVELCEPLRIEKVSLGNLELFSSSPNEFELGVSDRYPSRDWTTIGPFFAPAFRNLHSFQLPTNNSTFGKFLKVMIKSHHGKEHYCPLSLIKVFGRSEYEVLESETTHAEDVEQSNSNLALEEESNGPDEPSKQSVLGVAKDAVIEMVKKAASALVFNNVSNTELSSLETPQAATANLSCISLVQCIPDGPHKEEIYKFLSCHGDVLHTLHYIRSWCGWEFCHENLRTRSIGSPWMPEGLLVTIYGSSIIDALCNYMKPMNNCEIRREDEHVVELTSGVPNDTQSDERGTQSESPSAVNPNPDLQNNEQQQQTQLPVLPAPESTPPPPQVLPPLIPEEPAQKESVFVRLSNRIKNLERNQSLSSGYLEELSRRFKKQSEELSATHELFRKTLNESLSKCRNVEESLRFHINRLSRNNENLRELIAKVEIQRGGVAFFAVLQFLCTVFFLWKTHRQGQGQQQEVKGPSPSAAAAAKVTNSHHRTHSHKTGGDGSLIIQRKRSNSEQLKKVKKKKKKGLNGVTPLTLTPGSLTPNGDLQNFVFTSSRSSSVPPLEPSSSSSFSVYAASNSRSTSALTLPSVPNQSSSTATTGTDESQPASKKKSRLLSLFSVSKN